MEEDDNTVRITHYINPHCFWYKPEASYLPNHHEKQYMQKFNEDCEREFANRGYRGFSYSPNSELKVGDMVAQRNKEFQRWIRCEVDAVLIDLSGAVWLHLWAVDEGLPIKSYDEPIQPLPEAYINHPAHALRGAIRNILPSEVAYDYTQGKNVQTLSRKWLQGAVSVLQTVFDDALSVSLVVHARVKLKKEVVHFVDVSLTMHNNKSYNIVNILTTGCSDQVTISPDTEFLKVITTIKTLDMVRFQNNEGIDSATRHKPGSLLGHGVLSTLNQISKPTTDPKVQNKVEDWFSRNMEAQLAIKEETAFERSMDDIEACKSGEDSAAEEFDSFDQLATRAEMAEENPIKMTNVGDERDSTSNTMSSVDETSFLKRKLRQLQARQKQLELEKPKLPPIIGPAGCSVKFLLDSANARNKKY
ncbi:uncharacterized protein LOC131289119 [Anopheles ziemanni]|uniref:uncharacterized protein LOC131260515 n=1 Tax=Anopheles coustani TaxID=139045 RepID=UPI0026595AC4|nr:uncharacterized protein LOC131260515 [Anopheles coustani]XP_058174305.1 uncharacterized protein LOC131289119 [Anopheles ziemanni]